MAGVLPGPEHSHDLAIAPGSVTWRYASDARAMLGAGAALLLQVAHPTVAAGVRGHSDFERDPWGRLLRTLDFVNLLIYGGPDAAVSKLGMFFDQTKQDFETADPSAANFPR